MKFLVLLGALLCAVPAAAVDVTISVPNAKLLEVDAVRGPLTRLEWAKKALIEALVRDVAKLADATAAAEKAATQTTCDASFAASDATAVAARATAAGGW